MNYDGPAQVDPMSSCLQSVKPSLLGVGHVVLGTGISEQVILDSDLPDTTSTNGLAELDAAAVTTGHDRFESAKIFPIMPHTNPHHLQDPLDIWQSLNKSHGCIHHMP